MKHLKTKFLVPLIACLFTMQIASANSPDSTIVIKREIVESLLIKANQRDELAIDLGLSKNVIIDQKRKISKRNTAIEILSVIVIVLTGAVAIK